MPDPQQDPYQPRRPVPGKPIISSYPTPNFDDRIYKVHKDSRASQYQLPNPGDPFTGPEAEKYKDFLFCTAIPTDQTGWVDWIYVNERANQDEYNYSIKYPWRNEDYPQVTRTYLTLRSKYEKPNPDETDPMFPECVLVDQTETTLQDPALNVLFVGVTKVFERIPAETDVSLDRADGVIPFNLRVAVPAETTTEVLQGAEIETPEIVNEEDWNITDNTRTVFSRSRKRTKRVIPDGIVTLDKGFRLTREQQVGRKTSTWAIGNQRIVRKPTLIESNIEDVGNNTTIKEELVVPNVFAEPEFVSEVPNTFPIEFRGLNPVNSQAVTSAGQAAPPFVDINQGELKRSSRQVTDLIKRDEVVSQPLVALPKTLRDKVIDGIQTHGAEHGGICDVDRTLALEGQVQIEEGFQVISSSLKNLGNFLELRETKRLSGFSGPHLELLDGGEGYVCDPAVVFSGGQIGEDAAGTAVLTAIPVGGTNPGEDPGGTFTLSHTSNGDSNGLFYLLGARYNNGTWTNPFDLGVLRLRAQGNPSYPTSEQQLSNIVDREIDDYPFQLVPQSGGGHALYFDLGVGKAFTPNAVTIRSAIHAAGLNAYHATFQVQGSNNASEWTDIGGDIAIPINSPSTWNHETLPGSTAYRYLRIFGTSDQLPTVPPLSPTLVFDEIEFYGSLVIRPGVDLEYVHDGDEQGVFFYLGRRGGNGVWRNPITYGDVVADADGLITGTLDQITDRQPSNVCSNESPARAYYFDLGVNKSLICETLSFRQRTQFGSGNTAFNLQGRNDLNDPDDWTDLAVVHPSQAVDTWTTVEVLAQDGYRQFRIISSQPFFAIGELELYGALDLGPPSPPTYGVTAVNITNAGHDYLTAPQVRFLGDGSGAAGTAFLNNDGGVDRVEMTASGTGYTTAPEVAFVIVGGGRNAAATATLALGVVTAITVDDPGQDYETAPLVEVVGNGTGALAHAEVSVTGHVTAIVVDAGGTGYTLADILIRPAGGPSAIAHIGYGAAGVIVTNGGFGYSSPPAVQIGGGVNNVQAHAVLGFGVASVIINERGSGYTSDPTVVFGGDGTGATGTAVRGFPIASVTYTPNGTLYATAPDVVISGGGPYGQDAQFTAFVGRPLLTIQIGLQGEDYSSDVAVVITGDGADADATVDRSFALDSIGVDSGGTGYTTVEVEIDAPTGINGIQATAHAVLGGGAVTSIVIDNPGFGYLTLPGVTITGNGTGAAATAVLETNGAIDSITIVDVGEDYSEPPTVTLTASSGSGATFTASLDTSVSGKIVKVEVTSPGTGYTEAPTLSMSGGAATPVAVLDNEGNIVAVEMTDPGSEYTVADEVTFSGGGGSGASGTEVLETTGSVIAVVIDSGGTGLTEDSTVEFIGGEGEDAEAEVSLDGIGKVVTLELIDPGPEYTVAPDVSFFGCLDESGEAGWTYTDRLATGRRLHTTTVLLDGRVLVTGGFNADAPGDYLKSCEIFDPVTELWTSTTDMNVVRSEHTATLLDDGRVLVTGGDNGGPGGINTGEVYDPNDESWTLTPTFTGGRYEHAATRLLDGRVLIAGGVGTPANSRIYDPDLDTWTNTTGSMGVNRTKFPAMVTLPDGKALIVGGVTSGSLGYSELFDPSTGLWSSVSGTLLPNVQRSFPALTVLQGDGNTVLLSGGGSNIGSASENTCYLYDHVTESWTATGSMNVKRAEHRAVLRSDGTVVVMGGFSHDGIVGERIKKSTEFYDPDTETWTLLEDMNARRYEHGAAILPDDRILVCAGNVEGDEFEEDGDPKAEIYSAGGGTGIHATAIYVLGSSWPVLYDIITDPVEKIVVNVEKRIVPAGSQLPSNPGYVDILALDKYRSIQITSAIDLSSIPIPEEFWTTHNVSLPPTLSSIQAVYSRTKKKSVTVDTAYGSTVVKSSVNGKLKVHLIEGYNGPCKARVVRKFMFGPPSEGQTPDPLIINPSTGTIYLVSHAQEKTTSVGVVGGFGHIQDSIDEDEDVTALDIKGVLTGGLIANSSSGVQSVDVVQLTIDAINRAQQAGFFFDGFRTRVAQNVATAEATMFATVPPSTPASLEPGTTFLLSAPVEKWRFNLYVQTLTYLTIPTPSA